MLENEFNEKNREGKSARFLAFVMGFDNASLFSPLTAGFWALKRLLSEKGSEHTMSHSGLQRDILAFYKMVLRKAQQQPPEMRKCIEDYARSEFRKNVAVCRSFHRRRIP